MPRRRIAAALVVLANAAGGSSARADESYTLIGGGEAPPRTGTVAADADIVSQPIALAVRADGAIAFGSSGRVFLVQDGRLARVRVPVAPQLDLAFGPDGTLYVATCGELGHGPSAVWRASPGFPPVAVAGRRGRRGSSGDGGPAAAALLRCPRGVDLQADGGILIADLGANRIRRVAPDGIISTVAGTGRARSDGNGGQAVAAGVQPTDVAALPGGGFAIADLGPQGAEPAGIRTADHSVVRRVDANGVISTLSRSGASRIAAEPGGALLVADWTREDGLVRRLWPDGRLTPVTVASRERAGIPELIPVDGDPFEHEGAQVDGAVAAPDGGVLLAGDFAVRYVAPAAPALLAVGILPATRAPAERLTVSVRTTRAARLHVGVWRNGRRRASATADAAAGDVAVPIETPLPPGEYDVRVRAEGDGQIAVAHAFVLAGGVLPVAFAKRFVDSRLDLFRVFQNADAYRLRCRRMGDRRVDCGATRRRRCAAVVTLALRGDGSLTARQYDGGHGRRCRLRR